MPKITVFQHLRHPPKKKRRFHKACHQQEAEATPTNTISVHRNELNLRIVFGWSALVKRQGANVAVWDSVAAAMQQPVVSIMPILKEACVAAS